MLLPMPLAAPPSRTYQRSALWQMAGEPNRAIERRPFLPPAMLDVPPLTFGDTDLNRPGLTLIPAEDPGGQRLERGETHAWVLRNALVHGKYGVITIDDRVVEETLPHLPVHAIPGAAWAGEDRLRLPDLRTSVIVPAGYHLLACNLDNYCHWFIDGLSRFHPGEYGAFTPAPILLLPTLDVAFRQQSVDLMVPAGVPQLSLAAEGRALVRRLLYVPDLSGGAWNPHPALLDGFAAMRKRALGVVPPRRPWRRIYISRADSRNRVLANEPAVIARLAAAGFEIVQLSPLSVAEQIRIFAEASHIISPHGAGLTNIGFCQPGAALCELHMDRYVHWTFRRLAALRGVRYGCLVGQTATEQAGWVHGNSWTIELAALEAVLADARFSSVYSA